MAYKKIKYVFDPIGDTPVVNKAQVLKDIADFVQDEILAHVSEGKSPVDGEGKFKKLSKKYAELEKGGDRNPDLDLTGDMLNGLKVRPKGDKIEVFVDDDPGKVEGHNQHDKGLDHPLPKRRFIPDDDQDFVPKIRREISAIISENTVTEPVGNFQTTEKQTRAQEQSVKRAAMNILKQINFFGDEE